MSEPYYSDDLVTLHHGDCRAVLSEMSDRAVDAVITDPPYTERTHAKARSVNGGVVSKGITDFAAFTDHALRSVLEELARVSRSWVIATMDYRHAVDFDTDPPRGLKCQRVGVWVKPDPTPQLTGDRPGQGWEAIAYMHRAEGRSAWNGGGLHGNYIAGVVRGVGHPTAKPVSMVQDMVRKFTAIGETVLDPFAGSGTTLLAAATEGRRAIGVEVEERYCELIAKRLSNQTATLDFGTGA